MKKDLKDYLPLYLGCDCKTPLGIMELSSIDLHQQYPVWFRYKEKIGKPLEYTPQKNYDILVKTGIIGRGFYFSEVYPILRPLSDITQLEAKEIEMVRNEGYSPEAFRWLLSKHFDIFGLIEAELAIDKTTISGNKKQ